METEWAIALAVFVGFLSLLLGLALGAYLASRPARRRELELNEAEKTISKYAEALGQAMAANDSWLWLWERVNMGSTPAAALEQLETLDEYPPEIPLCQQSNS